MTLTLDISESLKARVDAIARRSRLSASEVIADALENGYSLEWQEQYLDRVEAGLAAADAGDFASEDDLARVRNKHRSG
ncbi:MAG TPA: ribbon-helix-helix protein, CopG family [Pelagibacterium sp.]|uniref:ribbon-helix-helix protein, CopG family n=1 Tax=Pelagibacterium sp. TaxID=1967288 RepID=UPI002BD4D03E|nr:ribbon-helix-helix protein, CopG family [Pelagibacterium sp.]HWJ86571.1 ribbon-helix-helix protein, CopG family [Pelagibacterium sp.]